MYLGIFTFKSPSPNNAPEGNKGNGGVSEAFPSKAPVLIQFKIVVFRGNDGEECQFNVFYTIFKLLGVKWKRKIAIKRKNKGKIKSKKDRE